MAEQNPLTNKRHPLLLHCPSCLEDVTAIQGTDKEDMFSCPGCMAFLRIVEIAGVKVVVLTWDKDNAKINNSKTFQFEAGEESPADHA